MKCLFILSLLFLVSCGTKEEEEKPKEIFTACSKALEQGGRCLRYMDRVIHFANFVPSFPEENNPFAVERVKEALDEISAKSDLSPFIYEFADKNLLEPITEQTQLNFRSFIQILPNLKFNELASELGVSLSDPNAIVAVNRNNKREFWIVFRASCFNSSDTTCTNNALSTMTSTKGVYALVARTLGRLVALNTRVCSDDPSDVMCANFPSDDQWSLLSQNKFYSEFEASLVAISNDKNFYDFFVPEE
ncbi:MAG: hypothetical protein GY909_15840 [Oligoflexia bacterium]|nr:hypothetical protein [Oligoflexia bacterium]